MKKLFTLTISAFFLLMMSCADPCKELSCSDQGVCDDGTCICDTGYEGTRCETEVRTKYYGTFSGSLICPGEPPSAASLLIRKSNIGVTYIQFADPNEPTSPDFFYELELIGNVASLPADTIIQNGFQYIINQKFTFTSINQIDLDFSAISTVESIICTGTMTRE